MNPGEVILLPIGVGDAFTRKHFTTCMAFGSGEDWLLIDCPHPVLRMIDEAATRSGIALDPAKIQALLLTHLHGDHASGIETYLYYTHFMLNRKAMIATHAAAAKRLWPNVLAAGMDQAVLTMDGAPVTMSAADYFETTVLVEGIPTTLGAFTIESRLTKHSIPTSAYRIRYQDRVLGFSADTPYDPGLIEWLAPCDLIVHEVTSAPASPVHTPYQHLAALPEALRSKMRLIHYPDDFDAEASVIPVLKAGEAVVV